MQRILFPTDFSENSWNAIQYAFAFFQGKSIDFHFLHVGFQTTAEDLKNDLHAQGVSLKTSETKGILSKLIDLKEKIQLLFPNHKHRLHTHFENTLFIEGIRKVVKNEEIDFIIMGTKGASGIKEATLGSHAGAVITRVKCPTLIVPEKASFQNPATIAFPTDFNLPYKNRVLKTLQIFATYHHATIKILRVVRKGGSLEEDQLKNKEFLTDALQNNPHSFHWIESPELEKGLQNFVDSMEIDIIAMVGKNLNFFQRLLFKPKVSKISYHTKIPFLVLHE
ncbi:MAG: universal stress protein [Flavobacteriaceae bacterium]